MYNLITVGETDGLELGVCVRVKNSEGHKVFGCVRLSLAIFFVQLSFGVPKA